MNKDQFSGADSINTAVLSYPEAYELIWATANLALPVVQGFDKKEDREIIAEEIGRLFDTVETLRESSRKNGASTNAHPSEGIRVSKILDEYINQVTVLCEESSEDDSTLPVEDNYSARELAMASLVSFMQIVFDDKASVSDQS